MNDTFIKKSIMVIFRIVSCIMYFVLRLYLGYRYYNKIENNICGMQETYQVISYLRASLGNSVSVLHFFIFNDVLTLAFAEI